MFSHYTVSALFAYTPLRSAWLRSFWWSCHGKVPFSYYGIFFSSFWRMLLTAGTSEQPSAQRLPGKSYCCPSLRPAPNEFFYGAAVICTSAPRCRSQHCCASRFLVYFTFSEGTLSWVNQSRPTWPISGLRSVDATFSPRTRWVLAK